MFWYGMVWYRMAWYGMVWCGMVWYGVLLGGGVYVFNNKFDNILLHFTIYWNGLGANITTLTLRIELTTNRNLQNISGTMCFRNQDALVQSVRVYCKVRDALSGL